MASQFSIDSSATPAKVKVPDPALLSVCKYPATAPPSSCYDLEDIVTICVNDRQKRRDYKAPRKLLTWHSSYFAAALDPEGGWLVGDNRTLELDCAHKVFGAFCCWLYTGRLKDLKDDNTGDHLSQKTLINIWIFADFHGIPALGNCAIDTSHERFVATWTMSDEVIKNLYKNTTANSRLRLYYIHIYQSCFSLEMVLQDASQWTTKEFLCDVLPVLARKSSAEHYRRSAATAMDRCEWHDHSGPGGKLRQDSRK